MPDFPCVCCQVLAPSHLDDGTAPGRAQNKEAAMSPETAAANARWFTKKKATREARATEKAGKKIKKFVQPKPEAVKAAVAKHVQDIKREAAKQKVTGPVTLKELKCSVKAKWPQIKGLADATYEELTRLLQANEGDSILAELHETWAKRARARHDAWLNGDSASAKVARAKVVSGRRTARHS